VRKLKCANCSKIVETEKELKKYVCPSCGAINTPEDPNAGFGDQACGCLLPDGFEFRLPAGKIGNKFTGYKYISPDNGDELTKTEWMLSFGLDPDLALEYMRSNAAADERDDDVDLSTLGKKKVRK